MKDKIREILEKYNDEDNLKVLSKSMFEYLIHDMDKEYLNEDLIFLIDNYEDLCNVYNEDMSSSKDDKKKQCFEYGFISSIIDMQHQADFRQREIKEFKSYNIGGLFPLLSFIYKGKLMGRLKTSVEALFDKRDIDWMFKNNMCFKKDYGEGKDKDIYIVLTSKGLRFYEFSKEVIDNL